MLSTAADPAAGRAPLSGASASRPPVPSFRITLAPAAAARVHELGLEVPVTGRVYVVVSRDATGEPREKVGVMGVPFWGRDVTGLRPGGEVDLAAGDTLVYGYPYADLGSLPPGTYRVQAFLNVYTTFHRADGHTVSLHLNSGAGQDLWRAPGNVASPVREIRVGAGNAAPVHLTLSEVIEPLEPVPAGGSLQQGNPTDRDLVRFVKIRSERLSRFWGHDMWIGVNVLLPAGYDAHPERRYPVVYLQGHFPGRSAPFGYGRGGERSGAFDAFWRSPDAPQVIAVTFRDANPYYDTSYSVNSANVGPYRDALLEELVPELERRFRAIPDAWARVLAGGSTGGWEALAMQVFDPDFFGGTWGWCPDPVDFRYYQIVNVYEDENAYVLHRGDVAVPRPGARSPDGSVRYTMAQENRMELAAGEHGRSGGQWDIWQAAYGPVGEDGYPAPIWDKRSGAIDHEVAGYWRENYDLRAILSRRWAVLGPKLTGRIHVAVGDMDTYYLNDAVQLLQASLDSTTSPPARATFEYGRGQPHCWIGRSPTNPDRELSYPEFVRIAADHMRRSAPPGVDLRWAGGR